MKKFKVGDTVSFYFRKCPYIFKSKNSYGIVTKVESKDRMYIKICDDYFDNTKSYCFFRNWVKELK